MKEAVYVILVAVFICVGSVFVGCSGGNRIYYEDDYFEISGFTVNQEIEGLYSAEGIIKTKNGAYTKSLLADVFLYDKDGNEIAKTLGLANDVPENGSATFTVVLFDSEDFLSKEQVDSISSYRIENLMTQENLDYIIDEKRQEAEEAEDALRKKYPNENL